MSENIVNGKDFLDKIVTVKMDRPLGTAHPKHGFIYEVNYGYIENTLSGDGEELDAYVLGEFAPLETFEGEVKAIIHRINDVEDKWIVAPENASFSKEQIMEKVTFQERFFDVKITM